MKIRVLYSSLNHKKQCICWSNVPGLTAVWWIDSLREPASSGRLGNCSYWRVGFIWALSSLKRGEDGEKKVVAYFAKLNKIQQHLNHKMIILAHVGSNWLKLHSDFYDADHLSFWVLTSLCGITWLLMNIHGYLLLFLVCAERRRNDVITAVTFTAPTMINSLNVHRSIAALGNSLYNYESITGSVRRQRVRS